MNTNKDVCITNKIFYRKYSTIIYERFVASANYGDGGDDGDEYLELSFIENFLYTIYEVNPSFIIYFSDNGNIDKLLLYCLKYIGNNGCTIFTLIERRNVKNSLVGGLNMVFYSNEKDNVLNKCSDIVFDIKNNILKGYSSDIQNDKILLLLTKQCRTSIVKSVTKQKNDGTDSEDSSEDESYNDQPNRPPRPPRNSHKNSTKDLIKKSAKNRTKASYRKRRDNFSKKTKYSFMNYINILSIDDIITDEIKKIVCRGFFDITYDKNISSFKSKKTNNTNNGYNIRKKYNDGYSEDYLEMLLDDTQTETIADMDPYYTSYLCDEEICSIIDTGDDSDFSMTDYEDNYQNGCCDEDYNGFNEPNEISLYNTAIYSDVINEMDFAIKVKKTLDRMSDDAANIDGNANIIDIIKILKDREFLAKFPQIMSKLIISKDNKLKNTYVQNNERKNKLHKSLASIIFGYKMNKK